MAEKTTTEDIVQLCSTIKKHLNHKQNIFWEFTRRDMNNSENAAYGDQDTEAFKVYHKLREDCERIEKQYADARSNVDKLAELASIGITKDPDALNGFDRELTFARNLVETLVSELNEQRERLAPRFVRSEHRNMICLDDFQLQYVMTALRDRDEEKMSDRKMQDRCLRKLKIAKDMKDYFDA